MGHCAKRCQLRALGRVQLALLYRPQARVEDNALAQIATSTRWTRQSTASRAKVTASKTWAKRSEAACAIMIGLQRTTRAMLRVHGCACSSSHAAHSERPVDMRMSCRDEDVDKCDGVDLLCATRSRSNLQAVATGKRLKYRVQTFGCGLTCRTKGPETTACSSI